VTDELYDYFGGNASKKVEPIEDDDVEVNEAEATADSDSPADKPSDAAGTQEQPAKKAGHWDFLAGVLGVGGKKAAETDKSSISQSATASKPAAESSATKSSSASGSGSASSPSSEPAPEQKNETKKPGFFESIFSSSDSSVEAKTESKKPEPAVAAPKPEPTFSNPADDLIGWTPVAAKPLASISADSEDAQSQADQLDDELDPSLNLRSKISMILLAATPKTGPMADADAEEARPAVGKMTSHPNHETRAAPNLVQAAEVGQTPPPRVTTPIAFRAFAFRAFSRRAR